MFVVAHRTPRTATQCAELAAAGVRVFELDIQLGRHGGLVVSHFLPVFGMRGWLENDNWRVRWRSFGDPRVEDVLALLPPSCDVLLDPKERTASRRAELVERVRALPDLPRYVVSTSQVDDLDRFRAAGLRTWRTLKDVAQLDAVLREGPLPDVAVSVRHSILTPERVARLSQSTPTIVAWTVNDVDRARRLVDWGVGGITTDRPDIITRI
jgi:glycerophosphoryl diester phosphodiesterase